MLRQLRRPLLVMLFVAIAWIVGVLLKSTVSQAEISAGQADRTPADGLRRERVDTLTKAASVADDMYARGLLSSTDASSCHEALLQAELETDSSVEDRNAWIATELAAARQRAPSSTHLDGNVGKLADLQAKAYRLHLQTLLTAARAK